MRREDPVPAADGGTYGVSMWFHTPDELEAAVRALGTHPSFVRWYREDEHGWIEVECRLDAMFVANAGGDGLTYALNGLCSMARLETGKDVGAWLNAWGTSSNEHGAATYQALLDSFEFPVEVELYVFPYAHEDVSEAELDAWLVSVATTVHRWVPFRVAVIDFEIHVSYEEALCMSEGVLRAEGDALRWHPYEVDERDS
jgi:hypothetical protein